MPIISWSSLLLTDFELDRLSNYLNLVHNFLVKNQKSLVAELDRLAAKIPEENRDDFYEAYSDDFNEVSDDFPRLLYSGFLVTWYSYMENVLFNISRGKGLKHSGDRRPGIPELQKFLFKNFREKLNAGDWQELNCLRETRNLIVHKKGNIPMSVEEEGKSQPFSYDGEIYSLRISPGLLRHLHQHDLIKPYGVFTVWPTLDYCKYVLVFSKQFLGNLAGSLELK